MNSRKPENLLRRETLVRQSQRNLNRFVYDYFGVCGWERNLINDSVNIFYPSSIPHSLDSKKLLTARSSRPDDREAYARTLISTFSGWTRTRTLWANSCIAPKLGLAFLTFGVVGRTRPYKESKAEKQVEELIDKVRKSTSDSEGTIRYLRGFAFYDGTTVYLLKPLSRRFWTRTAALNDADEILAHMMEEDGWGD